MSIRILTILTISLTFLTFACEKKEEKPAPAAEKAPETEKKTEAAKESTGAKMAMPDSLEELEKVKDKISKEDYENTKKRLEDIAAREKILFSKWAPDQIAFYKAVKEHGLKKNQDVNKLAEMYGKLPLETRFNSAYPMPLDDKNYSSDDDEKKYGTKFSPINSMNRNRTILFDKPPFVNYSFFDYHVVKAGAKKTVEVDASKGGFVYVGPSIGINGPEIEKSVAADFPNQVSFKLGGKELEKVPPQVAAPQLMMKGLQDVWDFKHFFKDQKPSSKTGQYFKIPNDTSGPVEFEVVIAETASDSLKKSEYFVSTHEFGFTILTTYTVPKYVETGKDIKLVAKIEKDGKKIKGFNIQDSYFFDHVKNVNLPLKFTEVSDGMFEAPFKVPFDGREYVEGRPDNRIQYTLKAVRKGEKASLGRLNQNHVYYHSSYCQVNAVKSWEYKKGEGLYIDLDIDIFKKEPKAKFRAQIEIATKDGHSMAHSAFTAKEVTIAANNKWSPKMFIHDRALIWPGSFMTAEALEKGEFKVLAQASVILPSMKLIAGESCNTYTWWDAPSNQ